jgi:hypothetical protein
MRPRGIRDLTFLTQSRRHTVATQDRCCTIVPYFKVHDGQLEAFRDLCKRFVEKTGQEAKCLYYGFSFDGDEVHCREAYVEELAKLRTPLAELNPQFFVLEYGFRR